jgi:hypothetical protein
MSKKQLFYAASGNGCEYSIRPEGDRAFVTACWISVPSKEEVEAFERFVLIKAKRMGVSCAHYGTPLKATTGRAPVTPKPKVRSAGKG